jgi:hypothetical protein
MSLRRRLLHEKIEKAEEKNDTKEMDALVAKLDSLEQQVGPDYIRVMDGLGDVVRFFGTTRIIPCTRLIRIRPPLPRTSR